MLNLKLPVLMEKSRVGQFGFLFISLMALFIVPELLPDEGNVRWQVPLFFSIVMLSALNAVSDRRAEFWIAALLLPFGLLPEWLHAFGVQNTEIWGKAISAVFLIYIAVLILRSVLRAREIDVEVILGALCVYLMLALVWGVAYQIVAARNPGAFSIPPAILEGAANPDQALASALHYFSFVTITTLGYGDIQPVASMARSLAITEALFGQIYLVTLIARLVSMESNQRMELGRSSDDS
ncbi:MAG: potassium channel family protein [marine benthic group bacterium]|nr:potassium channel family protein [Gemmatimonadota bacterium]MCL7962495.1 potassium channel family protein [Candidatus Carthagonibacter metallireducens]MCL7965689.1 potassium channel family protein [Gemmatimonadota bacterium]MCL7969999.1 potassium channel family protein [Gemmatimonadota bacterium]MCL7982438.1 potassium channel family protein [Gemmatimonadota bacterium]